MLVFGRVRESSYADPSTFFLKVPERESWVCFDDLGSCDYNNRPGQDPARHTNTLPESTKAYKPSSPTHLCHITSQHTASMPNP